MIPFIRYITASNAKRDHREINNRQEYELKLARGEVLMLTWYENLKL